MNKDISSSAEHVLAKCALGVQFDRLPQPVVYQAKRILVDTLACAFGGFDSEPGEIVRRTVKALGGTQESVILGAGERSSCALATLANGTAIRYLDMNDYFYGRDPSHPSGNVAAVLAVAERQHATGRELIEALVAAYEIQLRFTDCAGIWTRGWHHATNLQFSCAIAAAKLLKLDVSQTVHALAISGSHNNTLAQAQKGHIPLMKATAEGAVAKGGVEAALLAANGLTGPERLLDGELGWEKSVAGAIDYEGLTAPLESRFRMLEVGMKPYSARAAIQSPVAAAIDIRRQHELDVSAIAEIEVGLPDQILKMPSWDPKKFDPTNRETADHSFPYCMAVALVDGDCGPKQFDEEKLRSPVVRNLMSRMRFVPDAELTQSWHEAGGCRMTVTTASGGRYQSICRIPPGHAKRPLTDDELTQKFHRLADRLSAGRREQILDLLWSLDRCADVTQLATACL